MPTSLFAVPLAAEVVSPWAFHLHPDVLGLVAALGGGYWYALRRYGPLFHPRPDEPPATAKQRVLFAAGVLSIYLALGWPLHDISENHLFSAHMVQHLLLGFVAPPLLLLGTPEWLARLVVGRGRAQRAYAWLSRPIPAAIAFNALLAFLHWPRVVDVMLASELFHAATHLAFLAAALLMWSAMYSPLPEVVRLSPPGKMAFLFVQTLLPTVPASFLTFGDRTLYRVYETLPTLWGLTPRDDMQLAGLIMKVGGGLLLWTIIAVVFFRWASSEGAIGPGGGRGHGHRGGGPHPETTRDSSSGGRQDTGDSSSASGSRQDTSSTRTRR